MDIEDEVRQNTQNINVLTNTVTRVVAMVENSEKRHDSDIDLIKGLADDLKKVTERVISTVGLEKEVAMLTGEVGTLRHDVRTALAAGQAVETLRQRLSDDESTLSVHDTRLSAIEKRNENIDGAGKAVKFMIGVFWSVFGTAILTGGFFLIKFCIDQYMLAQQARGMIGGE